LPELREANQFSADGDAAADGTRSGSAHESEAELVSAAPDYHRHPGLVRDWSHRLRRLQGERLRTIRGLREHGTHSRLNTHHPTGDDFDSTGNDFGSTASGIESDRVTAAGC
jgi:hypothetical protein